MEKQPLCFLIYLSLNILPLSSWLLNPLSWHCRALLVDFRNCSFWGSVVCVCVCVLLREKSLKRKTKREMWPSPLCRWRKRVWCWTMSHSSKPVMVYTHPQTYEALWLCVVVAGLCNGWAQMLFDILCLSELLLVCFVPPF